MKRIAIVFNSLCSSSSIGVLFANLSQFFDLKQVSLTFFLATDPNMHQNLEENTIQNGIQVVHLHEVDQGRIIHWPLTLYRAFKQYGPFDVVHANMEFQNGIIVTVARLAGIPIRICHGHRPASVKSRCFLSSIYRKLMRFLMRHNAQIWLACSQNAGEYFFGKNHYRVLLNGIDLNRFRSTKLLSQSEEMRYHFITIGRMEIEKNPFFLLDVFESIHRRVPETYLSWIGTGKLQSELKNRVQEKKLTEVVEFLGPREDVAEILGHADYFLFPSQYEGFGIAVLEAQTAGLDCFISDTIPCIVDCGKCMFFSLQLSADEWADVIVRYILYGQKMELNLEKLQKFDIRIMAQKLTKLYLYGDF